MKKGPKLQRERNAAIVRLRAQGHSTPTIAAQFKISQGRVSQILGKGDELEKRRAELTKRYGACPNIKKLGDRTPIETLILCNAGLHGWTVRVCQLRNASIPVRTLGDLRNRTDEELLREPHLGNRMVAQLRLFCPQRARTKRN